MNAIVALCHFCENHGPSIIFCTQVFHSESLLKSDTSFLLDDGKGLEDNQPIANTAQKLDKRLDKNVSSSVSKSEVKCEACRSLPIGLSGYRSNDREANVSYISSQYPSSHQVFSMVRQACVRSISSEVSPGRDGPGPIFFGDESSGYVFSHTFIVKDSQYSRGFQRRYSIIVVMMDKIYLLNSWPFLFKHIRDIIEEIQAKAMKVYEAEQAKNPTQGKQFFGHGRHVNIKAITQSKPARSLVDLTGDKHIFRKLHQTFTWLLKAGGNRLTEKLLEGPPTEDSIIDVEKQEETEEGFVLLTSIKDIKDEQVEECMEPDNTDLDCPVFTNVRHILKVLGYSQFHTLAHHVVIGNQVIVQGHRRRLVRSIIDCLKTLLPKGCCKVIYYTNTYEDAWRCNFLGITPSTCPPEHIEHYVLISIHEACQGEDQDEEVEDAVLSLQDEKFSGFVFTVHSPNALPEKGPGILSKIEYALMDDNLADSVVEQCVLCLKEEWMNKVKVLFKFTKAGGSRSVEDTKELLNVVGAQEEDKVVLQFWRTGLSAQYRHHMLSSAVSNTKC